VAGWRGHLGSRSLVAAHFTFFVEAAGLESRGGGANLPGDFDGSVPARIETAVIDTEFVLHYIRVLKTRLRNVTVTLEEPVARWARIEAARKETSVSRLLGSILKERMLDNRRYQSAMRRALTRKAFLKTEGQYLSREEAHYRTGLR
jgi:hypothetical protein